MASEQQDREIRRVMAKYNAKTTTTTTATTAVTEKVNTTVTAVKVVEEKKNSDKNETSRASQKLKKDGFASIGEHIYGAICFYIPCAIVGCGMGIVYYALATAYAGQSSEDAVPYVVASTLGGFWLTCGFAIITNDLLRASLVLRPRIVRYTVVAITALIAYNVINAFLVATF